MPIEVPKQSRQDTDIVLLFVCGCGNPSDLQLLFGRRMVVWIERDGHQPVHCLLGDVAIDAYLCLFLE